MIAVVQAHPYPDRSRANRILADAIADLPGIVVRSLYDLYPDYAIDVEAEQRVLAAADVVVWQHPIFWYTPPALQKLWFEKVLTPGFAYAACVPLSESVANRISPVKLIRSSAAFLSSCSIRGVSSARVVPRW